jgi:beta-fructofuranosidase
MNLTNESGGRGRAAFPVLVLLACVGLAIGSVQAAESKDAAAVKPKTFAVNDKTLVAWVYLANTTQRAGSVLTLIDDQERFDAIVFGERAPGKWMAGSDFFRRTQADQSNYPPETADDQTLVQMAVVYDKQAVTVFRNGDRYAHYTIDQPQSFDEDVTVLLGLRHVGQMGEIGFLSGIFE